MAMSIYFESCFRQRPYENNFKPENCQEWTVVEKWSITPRVIQEISLVKEDEYFESYYYVDLQIVSEFQGNDSRIFKSERMASNNIKFLIKGNEFSCFETDCGDVDANNENFNRNNSYRYKVTLTPILQLSDERFLKSGKSMKMDLLGGLKALSNDVFSMKGNLFSDITISCGNKRVKAHRNILFSRSTVFKRFLQGVEDEEVHRCLEIESVIVETKGNSVNDSSCSSDNSTNNDSKAAAIHAEEDNNAQANLNIETETNADEATNDDKSSIIMHSDKGMKRKSNDDTTENEKDCTTINAEKNKTQNILEIKPKICDDATVDDSTNDCNGTEATHVKKDNEIKHYLGIKSEVPDYYFENHDYTNDKNDSTNANGTSAMRVQKENEVQHYLGITTDILENDNSMNDNNDSTNTNGTSAMRVQKENEIQHYLGIESDILENHNCTKDNDSTNTNSILAMCSEKNNEVQNKVNSKQNSFEKELESAFNIDASTSAVPVLDQDEEIQYDIEFNSDSESDDGNDTLAMSADKGREVQNNVEIQPDCIPNNNEVLPPVIEEDELQNQDPQSGESDNASVISSDGNALKIRLKRVHSSIFHEFIDFIYSGQYRTADVKNAKDLLTAARDYGICDLEYKCIMYLKSQISVETSDDIYNFASEYKCEDLQIYVLDYLKNKIIGRGRRNSDLIQMIEQQEMDVLDEEGMTTVEKIRWLKVMRNHPTYFEDILNLKKGKKIREVFLRLFHETNDIMADYRERLGCISSVSAANLGNDEDQDMTR